MQPKNSRGSCFVRFGLLIASCIAAEQTTIASVREITNFTELRDGVFHDVGEGPVNVVNTVILDDVTITPNVTILGGGFSSWAPGDADNPGDGTGYGTGETLPDTIVLDFSVPVAAFGVSFFHMAPDRSLSNSLPAVLDLYDGRNATGNLLSSITSTGYVDLDARRTIDFVAGWSGQRDILSARLSGSSEPFGFSVDGYGLSLTPVPEPSGEFLSLALAGILFHKRRKFAK